MTASKIEEVARAICVADGVDPDAEGCGLGVQMPAGEKYPLWRARLKQARAAIEALRIDDVIYYVDGRPNASPFNLHWNKCIDVILEKVTSP